MPHCYRCNMRQRIARLCLPPTHLAYETPNDHSPNLTKSAATCCVQLMSCLGRGPALNLAPTCSPGASITGYNTSIGAPSKYCPVRCDHSRSVGRRRRLSPDSGVSFHH